MIKHDFKQSYKTRQFASWFIHHLLVNPALVLVQSPNIPDCGWFLFICYYYYIYTPYYRYTTSYNNICIYIIHSNTIYDILYIIIDQQTALWFAWLLLRFPSNS